MYLGDNILQSLLLISALLNSTEMREIGPLDTIEMQQRGKMYDASYSPKYIGSIGMNHDVRKMQYSIGNEIVRQSVIQRGVGVLYLSVTALCNKMEQGIDCIAERIPYGVSLPNIMSGIYRRITIVSTLYEVMIKKRYRAKRVSKLHLKHGIESSPYRLEKQYAFKKYYGLLQLVNKLQGLSQSGTGMHLKKWLIIEGLVLSILFGLASHSAAIGCAVTVVVILVDYLMHAAIQDTHSFYSNKLDEADINLQAIELKENNIILRNTVHQLKIQQDAWSLKLKALRLQQATALSFGSGITFQGFSYGAKKRNMMVR